MTRPLLAAPVLVALALVVTTPSLARAQRSNPCSPRVEAWIERCAESEGLALESRVCPAGLVIVEAGSGESSVTVELGAASASSFERAGAIGLSPVGSFPDWSEEPEARRAVFDALVRCAARDPELFGAASQAAPTDVAPSAEGTGAGTEVSGHTAPRPPLPWRALGGVVLALALLLTARAPSRREGLALAALYGVTFAGRWLVLPHAFFHQNGQGPHWVRLALDDVSGLSAYGPGYAELFSALAHAADQAPDGAVFLAQALVAALLPLLGWSLARSLGAGAGAWLVAAFLAVDPLLGRIGQSESYFSIILVLLVASGACAAAGARARLGWAWRLVAAAAAALFAAQAVRVHPLAWAPALTLPAVFLMNPLALGRRQAGLLAAQVALALGLVALLSAGAVERVASGALASWLPEGGPELRLPPWPALLALGVALLGALAHPRRLRLLLLVLLAGAALMTEASTNLLRNKDAPAYAAAYTWLFAPALLAAAAALVAAWRARGGRPRLLAFAALAASALVVVAVDAHRVDVATDAEEQTWAMEWRDELPGDATVVYLGRADERILMLPIYRQSSVRELPLRSGEPIPALPDERTLFYYRSSLCSTPEGAQACADIERALLLEPVEARTFAPVASQPWHPLGPGAIETALFRATPRESNP